MPFFIKRLLIPVVLLISLLLACSPSSQTRAEEDVDSPPARSISSERVTEPANNTRVKALVIDIIDGDTIKVSINGIVFKVRYIGINAPELNSADAATRGIARIATEMNRQLVSGKTVELEKDVSETDKYGRLLRYVYANGTMVNAELVKCGLARSVAYSPDIKYQGLLNSLQDIAKASGNGIWNPGE